MIQLSAAQARRVTLGAQGLTGSRPRGRVDRRHVRSVFDRLQVVQIDSVNVLARSHYLPLFARLGPYRMQLLDELAYRHREVYEAWAHEASFVAVDLQPLLRLRTSAAANPRWDRWAAANRPLLDTVVREVEERGPLRAADLPGAQPGRGPWWGWSEAKRAFECLFALGRLAVADRRTFERRYDLVERVLPAEVLDRPTPTPLDARRGLLAHAGRALGVATAEDLVDYFRLRITASRPALAALVEEGVLVPATVEGWDRPAYLHRDATTPRRTGRVALLSPFDNAVWFRDRTERLFGMRYRIEIYTPAPKRQYGYYVLPVLVDDALVGRLDMKADRGAGVLRVLSAHAEPGVSLADHASRILDELELMAEWLGLDLDADPLSGS